MIGTDLAYRRTAAESASGLGPLISLFDTLAGDLQRAAAAQREDNIERRCREVRHALLVIGHLEGWVNRGPGGTLAQELIDFYSMLRRKLIQAQTRKSAEILEQLMAKVLELREHWQQIELRTEPSGPEILRPVIQIPSGYPTPQIERLRGSWSA
jgi:flagellar biosynthetic protein FliS